MTELEIKNYVNKTIDDRLEDIAEKAATRALEKVYIEVGKGFLRKIVWAAGIIAFGVLSWMAGRGVKLPSP